MTEIRPFQEEFCDDAAALHMRAMRGQSRTPSPALARYFREVLLENPWAVPEIPSLVCLENGKLIGMLGVIPRPLEFRGENITAATLTQFMVDPSHRRGGAAVQLLRRCFQGPQEMSWADGAAEPVHLLHKALGGQPANFYSLHWMRILRPFGTVRDALSRRPAAPRILHALAAAAAPPGDFLAARLPVFRPLRPAGSWQAAAPDELFECIAEIGWREPLRPRYEIDSFRWLLAQMNRARSLGEVRTIIVKDSAGLRCGWLVYFAKRGGTAYLMQLGTRRADHFETVFRALLADAWDQGCVVAKGTARPEQLTTVTKNYCVFRHAESSALIHSRNTDLLRTVRLGEAALSGLDGERWQLFAPESW